MLPPFRRSLLFTAKVLTTVAVLATTSIGLAPAFAATSISGPPAATGRVVVSEPIQVTGEFDGGNQEFVGVGDGGQGEGQDALFELAAGATIRNVLIGSPGDDGIHCDGSCTIDGVFWLDVGEDAATQLGTDDAGQVMTIRNGGAFNAADKVFQNNGPGTMIIENMLFENVGKVYRSCGNCSEQFARTAVITDITVRGEVEAVAGVNSNLGDRATLSGVTADAGSVLCELFEGNDTGDEPVSISEEPDGVACAVQ